MIKKDSLQALNPNHTILYVEDDDILRQNTAELFENFFHTIVLAKDGKEALSLYPQDFDIIITDIHMPNMDGIALSKAILAINKKQKIIVISAYNDTKYFIELINIGVAGFIQKPLNLEQVSTILGEVSAQIDIEKQNNLYIFIDTIFKWHKVLKILYKDDIKISLTANETELLHLFLNNLGQTFTDFDIFNHIYYDDADKTFSADAIKSLIKRLRKKLPHDIIHNHKNIGYSLTLTLS